MEMTLSVEEGTLALGSASAVCSEEALESSKIKFRGSLYAVNNALSGLTYLVRFLLVSYTPIGSKRTD